MPGENGNAERKPWRPPCSLPWQEGVQAPGHALVIRQNTVCVPTKFNADLGTVEPSQRRVRRAPERDSSLWMDDGPRLDFPRARGAYGIGGRLPAQHLYPRLSQSNRPWMARGIAMESCQRRPLANLVLEIWSTLRAAQRRYACVPVLAIAALGSVGVLAQSPVQSCNVPTGTAKPAFCSAAPGDRSEGWLRQGRSETMSQHGMVTTSQSVAARQVCAF